MKERTLIEVIRAMQPPVPPGWMGIGDDAAWILPDGSGWAISQDMLVEQVHFRRDWATADEIGRKAAEVNLSDLAAMGALPRAALTSVALPGDVRDAWVEQLYRGMTAVFSAHGVPIVGGDTVSSPNQVVIDVVVLGTAQHPVLRRGGEIGDYVVVSGTVGASRVGYELLARGIGLESSVDPAERAVIAAHLQPSAQVALGLAAAPWVRSMTDVSDALADEVRGLIEGANLGAEIWLERLPIMEATRVVSARWDRPVEAWALWGAEDYQLLMTIDPSHLADLQAAARRVKSVVHVIGQISDTPGLRCWRSGELVEISGEGVAFEHFPG